MTSPRRQPMRAVASATPAESRARDLRGKNYVGGRPHSELTRRGNSAVRGVTSGVSDSQSGHNPTRLSTLVSRSRAFIRGQQARDLPRLRLGPRRHEENEIEIDDASLSGLE